MIRIDQFDDVFRGVGKNHYPTHLVNQIEQAQERLGGELFFHQLLRTLQIEATTRYPPKNAKEFRELHKLIASASCQETQKQSLLYYLLKDCGLVAKDQTAAEQFQKDCSLPKKYWLCMQGLWHLDKLEYKEAIQFLAQPSLVPVFSSQILHALLHADEYSLALSYYSAMSPPLNTPELLDTFFRALCSASVTQGFFFLRRQSPSPESRRSMLEQLVDAVLSLPGGDNKKNKAAELLDLPLDDLEEEWLKDILRNYKGPSSGLAKDALLMRSLAKGDYGRALDQISQGKASTRNVNGVTWDSIAASLERGVGDKAGLSGWTAEA